MTFLDEHLYTGGLDMLMQQLAWRSLRSAPELMWHWAFATGRVPHMMEC